MTRFRRCPSCGELAEVPDGAFACPACGAVVAAPAEGTRRAAVLGVEPPARPSHGAAWRVGVLFVAALLAALGFTGHVVWRVLAPVAVAALPPAESPAPAAVAAAPPTNRTCPAPKPRPSTPRVAAPIELETPDRGPADWRRDWGPSEPAGLRLRVSLPGERRTRLVDLPGGVVGVEESGAEGPARYRVLALPSPDVSLTPATLPKLLASLRPDPITAPAFETVGAQEYVGWRCRGYDGTEWTVLAFARAGKLVLLVRSLDADELAKSPGFDAAAGWKRFAGSVELLRAD